MKCNHSYNTHKLTVQCTCLCGDQVSQVCTTPLYTICTRFDWIMCQVVTYQRLYTIEKSKLSTQKVAAYERWSPMRGSNYSDLTLTPQAEVRCPRGPGGCNRNHTPKAPEHPTGLPKPATQPRAPRIRPLNPSTRHTHAQMAQ